VPLAACQPHATPSQDTASSDAPLAQNMPGRATPVNDAAVPTASSSAAGQVGFCVTGEPVLYACELEGGSIVSVCGAENANGQRFAQYRFGRAGRTPELVWPSTAEPGELTIARVGYSGGGALQIRFDRGGSTYIVQMASRSAAATAGPSTRPVRARLTGLTQMICWVSRSIPPTLSNCPSDDAPE
jgi:hypothetical protein